MLRDVRRRLAIMIYPEWDGHPWPPERAMTPAKLLSLLSMFAAHVGRSAATVAKWAGSHERLPDRLGKGLGRNFSTLDRVGRWLSANWPEDLEWPADIPRPPSPEKDPVDDAV